MGKELKLILRRLENKGFKITSNDGTRRKLYPPDKRLPFYSLHVGPSAIMPLTQFAKRQWGIDLYNF
jgi:hypothetical protein